MKLILRDSLIDFSVDSWGKLKDMILGMVRNIEKRQNLKIILGLCLVWTFCSASGQEHAQMTMGNGESNYIVLEDVQRNGKC